MLLSAEMLNMLNVFLECSRKMFFFLKNVEYGEYVECFLNLQTLPGAAQKKQRSTLQL